MTATPGARRSAHSRCWQVECEAITCPVEGGSGVSLASWCDLAMTSDALWSDAGVGFEQLMRATHEALILSVREGGGVGPFQLDADREVITAVAAGKSRDAGMPGPLLTRDVLQQLAMTANEEVRGDTQAADGLEIRVGAGIELSKKEVVDPRSAEVARRQADIMNDQEVDLGPWWPWVVMW